MKIDESCINHNALRLIGENVSELYDFVDPKDDCDHVRIAVLGEIRGICQMADALKEVLRA